MKIRFKHQPPATVEGMRNVVWVNKGKAMLKLSRAQGGNW